MNILELFAGSRSFSKAAEELGHKTYSTDIQDFKKIDQVSDIFNFDINKIPFIPDIIWASPPCTTFSIAGIRHHFNIDGTPKSSDAVMGIKIVKRTLEIIEQLSPKFYYIENPRGKLRKLSMAKNLMLRRDVTYCSYGENRMKPTDIWTNDFCWIPRSMCWNNNKNCHHESAPRGSMTGVQGMKNAYERSRVPKELCLEILEGVQCKKN